MNGRLGNVDDLVSHVQRRAEQRAVALESQGETRAREIEEHGEEKAEAVRREILDAGRRAAAEARRQRLAAAELERRHRRLNAREDRLERVWDAARRELARRGTEGIAPETLARLARDAARRLGGDEVTIELDEISLRGIDADDVAAWSEADAPTLILAAEPLPRGHGLVARSGRASIDATFEGRLERARHDLRTEIDMLLSQTDDGHDS